MSENLSAFKRNSLKGEETITFYFFQLHRKCITPPKYASKFATLYAKICCMSRAPQMTSRGFSAALENEFDRNILYV